MYLLWEKYLLRLFALRSAHHLGCGRNLLRDLSPEDQGYKIQCLSLASSFLLPLFFFFLFFLTFVKYVWQLNQKLHLSNIVFSGWRKMLLFYLDKCNYLIILICNIKRLDRGNIFILQSPKLLIPLKCGKLCIHFNAFKGEIWSSGSPHL